MHRNLHVLHEVVQRIAELLARKLRLLVGLRVHERIDTVRLIEELHRVRLKVRCGHLLIRVERALNHSAGLDILDLRTDERGTLSRLHVLEIDNLPDAPIVFDGEAGAEIGAVNHIIRSSIQYIFSAYYSGFTGRFQ